MRSIICKNVIRTPHGTKPIKNEKDIVLYDVTHEVALILKSEIIATLYHISEGSEVPGDKAMKKYAITPNARQEREPDYIKTLRRMLEYREDHLRFMKNFTVSYTNNKAKKIYRAVKAHKKFPISLCQ